MGTLQSHSAAREGPRARSTAPNGATSVLAQVVHLMWVDLVQSRWQIAVFVGVVTLSAANALSNANARPVENAAGIASLFLSFVLTGGAALVLIGSIIQNDSPIDAAAFWRAVPISTMKLVTAKLLALFVALILPLVVAQLIVLPWYADSSQQIVTVTMWSLLLFLQSCLGWAIIAAITPSTMSFFVAFIVYTAVHYVFDNVPSVINGGLQASDSQILGGGPILLCAILFSWLLLLYSRGRSSLPMRKLSVVVLLVIALAPTAFSAASVAVRHVRLPASMPAVVPANFSAAITHDTVLVSFNVAAPEHFHRLSIDDVRATLVSPTSRRLQLRGISGMSGGSYNTNRKERQFESALLDLRTDVLTIDSTVHPAVAKVLLRFVRLDSTPRALFGEKGLRLEFSGLLENQAFDTLTLFSADTDRVQHYKGISIRTAVVMQEDNQKSLQLQLWSLSPARQMSVNLSRFFENSFAAYAMFGQLPDTIRFVQRGNDYSRWLVSKTRNDSLLLRTSVGSATSFMLPIPGTVFESGVRVLEPHDHLGRRANLIEVTGGTLAETSWRHVSTRFLKVTASVR